MTSRAPVSDGLLERRIARLLTIGTYAAVALVIAGVVLMLANGIDPLAEPTSAFAPATLVADLVALRPVAFIWIGVLVLIAVPVLRVALEALGYLRAGERTLALIAGLILLVVAISVVVALLGR